MLKYNENEINDIEYRKFINHLINLINDHINTPSETLLSPINFNSFKNSFYLVYLKSSEI